MRGLLFIIIVILLAAFFPGLLGYIGIGAVAGLSSIDNWVWWIIGIVIGLCVLGAFHEGISARKHIEEDFEKYPDDTYEARATRTRLKVEDVHRLRPSPAKTPPPSADAAKPPAPPADVAKRRDSPDRGNIDTAARDRIHELANRLPESELETAERVLAGLLARPLSRPGHGGADRGLGDDAAVTDREAEPIEEGERGS